MADKNPIYDYLKSEGLTDLSEQDFVNKYSDREQLQPVYDWLKENGNTDLEFEPFADKYFPSPKSNEVSSQGSAVTSGISGEPSQTSQSTSTDQATLAEQSTGVGYVLPEGSVDLTNPEQGIYAYYDPNLVNVDTGEMGDVVNRLEAVDISPTREQLGLQEEDTLSAIGSIKNSLRNIGTQIRGFDDRAVLTSTGVFSWMFGEDLARKVYNFLEVTDDRTFDSAREDAIAELERLGEEMLPTLGIVESWEDRSLPGVVAGVANGASSMMSTLITALPTLGGGIGIDLIGGSFESYNNAKAESLGITTQELYDSKQADFSTPLLMGVLGTALEAVGLSGVTRSITSKITGSIAKKMSVMGLDMNKEGMTEWVQQGLEEYGNAKARGASEEEAISALTDALVSTEGLEAYLQGATGAGVTIAGGRGARNVVNRESRVKVDDNSRKIQSIVKDLSKVTDPVVKDQMLESAGELSNEINQLTNENNEVLENLTPVQVDQATQLTTNIEAITEAIVNDDDSDAPMSTDTRQALEDRRNQLSQELDGIVSNIQQTTDEGNQVDSEIAVEDAQVDDVQEQTQTAEGLVGQQEVPAGSRLFSEPVAGLAELSNSYKEASNISTPEGQPIRQLDQERSVRIADAYEAMEHNPNDPEVKASYEAMASETLSQYNTIQDAGYTVELWDGEGEPYANSTAMLDDLRNNNHLYVLPTEAEFGETPITDQQRQENPLLRDSGITDANGRRMLINDVFRFVHDVFGHGERGNSFGPLGEENAWDVHARMYSDQARRAMTTETRGQNSWVNFGPQLRNSEGRVPRRGEEGYVPVSERAFAEQKIGLLPEEFSQLEPVQQTEAFSGAEQSELVNTVSQMQGVTDAPTFVNSIRNSLSDSNIRQNRISELEQRFQQRRERGGNLGIAQDPRQEAQYWADVTEYAILKIADGTIKTVEALAKALNVNSNDSNLQKAFADATEVNRIINEATVPEVRERPKTTIRRTTDGRIQGRVELTNKQALTNRIRTLNEGARLGKQAIVQARQDIKDLVSDLSQARAFRGTANASALRRVANFVNNANTPRQVERATEVIQKVVDDVAFGRKLANVETYKQRIKRVARSKNTPKDLASVLRDFSNINPRDLEVNQLDEFLTLAESIYRRETSVSNVNNRELQRLIDIAEATRQREQESRAEAQSEPEAQERKIESLKERLVREAGVSEEVLTQIDNRSKPLDEIIQELQETLNNSRESREEKVRATAKAYESEIKSVSQELLDAQPNAEARGLLKGFLDANISVDNIPKSRLAGYVTTLYNLRNNNSIVGLGEYQVYNEAVSRTSNKSLVEKITSMFGTPGRLVQKLNELGASSGSATRIASLANPRDIGQVESFTGFGDFYSKAQSVFVNTVAPFRKRINDITTKYRRDLQNDPVSTSLLGIYSDVIQYRTSWDAERIQQEYKMRVNAWGESLRLLEERTNPDSGNYNSTFARDNKGSISNLRKALQKIASKTTNSDGEIVWEPKVTQSQMWDMLPRGQREIYNFARETFDGSRDKFFAVSQYYGGIDVETDWANYIPRSYSNLTPVDMRRTSKVLSSAETSITSIMEDPFTGSLVKENTGSGQSRLIDGDKLPQGKVLNHDFVNNFMNEALSVAYDSETTGERKLMSLMLDRERTGMQFNDEVPFEMFRSSVARKLLGDRRALRVHSMDQTVINKVLAKTRLLGTAKALGGVFQVVKQASPLGEVASRVSPQTFSDALKLYTNKEARERILGSGNAQLRNISQYYKTPKSPNVNVSDKEVSRIREVLRTAGMKADDITNVLAEWSLTPLQVSDKLYSDIGYLAFYIDQAKKNGNGVVNLGKVDTDAISYANSQNSIVMNESDQSQQGDFATNKLIRAINPFISFSVNSTNSLIISIDKLNRATSKADKVKYTKEVAGILANKILFNAVGAGIRYLGVYSGGRIIIEAIMNSDEPDEEKERLIQSVKDDVESRQKLNAVRSVGYALTDIVYGGILQNQVEPLFDFLTKPIVESLFNENYLLSAGYSDSQRYVESNPIKQLTAYMGTSGVFVNGVVDTYNLAGKYFESDERYKERLYGELTADKNAVFVDPFYLDDESGMLGRPVWDEATNLTGLIASSVSLLGASSQEVASLRRYSSTIANTIMKNENGVVTKKSVEDVVKEARKIREIKVYGVPITLDQEQIGWYLVERDKAVKRLYKKYKQQPDETRSEYEKSISKMADEDMQDLYYKTYKKQFDEQEALKIRKEDKEYTIQEMRLDYQKRRRNANR